MNRSTLTAALSCILALACSERVDVPSADISGDPSGSRAATVAQTPPESTSEVTLTEAAGQKLYQSMCWACHGRSGRGDGPATKAATGPAPPNFQTEGYATLEVSEILRRFDGILEGSDSTHPHMRAVVPLLDPERFVAALEFVPTLAYPAEVPGSALMGEVTYLDRCAPCHGRDGRGMGDLSPMLLIAAADLTADPFVANRDFDAVFDLIKFGGSDQVHGSSMPAWGVVFSDGEIWDLVAYVASLQPGVLKPRSM